MAAQGHTPKTMSSRLMGMKFMQRSAASPTTSKASDSPSAKRSKLNNGSPHARGATEQEAFEEVQAQEDAKREAILDKLAEEAGDTKWVLREPMKTKQSLSIINAGYGAIDGTVASSQDLHNNDGSDNSDDGEEGKDLARDALYSAGGIAGRKSFGKFNRQIEKRYNPHLSSSPGEGEDDSDSTNGSSNDDDDDERHSSAVTDEDTPKGKKSSSVADELRAKKKAKRQEEKKASREKAERRRSKEVKLNRHMTSISGGGFKGSKPQQACFTCGETGHKAADCPERGRHKKRKGKVT